MKDITSIDENLKVEHMLPENVKSGLDFFDPEEKPFEINGVFREGDKFVRMPRDIAQTVSEGVHHLVTCTAGGRIRFKTNSPSIAIRASIPWHGGFSHMPLTGLMGFDLYMTDNGIHRYAGTFTPPSSGIKGYESIVNLPNSEMREFTLNFPLYNGVFDIMIGLCKGSALEAPSKFSEPPIVYYGSSITQGGCASRPGNSYQAIIHREINTDYINLGFSGSCKAEDTMIDYLCSMDMSIFVYDYDHNAPTAEYLESTHFKGYSRIRAAHPSLPIILMTRPKYYLNEEEIRRNEIVRTTYQKAIENGDKAIYFVDGRELLDENMREISLVDNCHPADAGFYGMAKRLIPLIKDILKNK